MAVDPLLYLNSFILSQLLGKDELDLKVGQVMKP